MRITTQLLLPLLAVAWLTAAAAPCAGSVAAADDTHDTHDTSGADHPSHASPSAHAGKHHASCPHCQAGGGEEHGPSSAKHGSCAGTDLTRDNRGNVPVKWEVKYFLPVVSPNFSTASVVPNAVRCALPSVHPPSARVALNVRYCVYLI